jgi:hypothetical protein
MEIRINPAYNFVWDYHCCIDDCYKWRSISVFDISLHDTYFVLYPAEAIFICFTLIAAIVYLLKAASEVFSNFYSCLILSILLIVLSLYLIRPQIMLYQILNLKSGLSTLPTAAEAGKSIFPKTIIKILIIQGILIVGGLALGIRCRSLRKHVKSVP